MLKRLICWSFVLVISLTPAMLCAAESGLTPDEMTASAVDIATVRDDATSTRLTVDASQRELTQVEFDGETFDRAMIGLEPTTSVAGWPELPMIPRMVLVPPTADIRLVVHNIDSHIERDYHPFILPVQDGTVPADQPGIADVEYAQYDGFWPPEPVVVDEPVILRGHRMVRVTLFPMQYNPSTGETRYNEDVDFELIYEGTGSNIIENPNRQLQSTTYNRMVDKLVVNPPRRDNPQNPVSGSYLIIYPDNDQVEDAIQPLIEWRARQGWEVHPVRLDGNPNNSTIKRDIIQEAYEEWDNPPEMVALVGDAGGSVNIPAWSQTDLDYVLLEGNDLFADAAIGRISVDGVNQLRSVVAKLVNYEADPWMGNDGNDTDWYLRGMVCAGESISGISTVLINRWVRRELLDHGYEEVAEWYYNNPQGSVPQFFQNQFREGVAFSNYRGYIGISGVTPNAVMAYQAHRKYPTAVILTCGSGNYIDRFGMSEAMFRSPGGANGCVGFCTSGTHTKYNNAVSCGVWVGLLKHGHYHFGPAVNNGRYEVLWQYGAAANSFPRWCNLMGDPATHIFTGIPQLIAVTHEETLPLGGSHLSVYVEDEEEENPLIDAMVCLYKADDECQILGWTDEDGNVEFTIPPDALTEGELMVTVTKHNIKPYLGEVEIEEAELFLGASEWNANDDDGGDADGEANPGEMIELEIELTNFGTEVPDGAVSVTAQSLSPWVVVDDGAVELDEAPGVGRSTMVMFPIQVHAAAPDGAVLLIAVDATVGEDTYSSLVAVEAFSPKLSVTEVSFQGGELVRGDIKTVDFELTNTGRKLIGPFSVTLRSSSDVVSALEDHAEYEGLDPRESGEILGDLFRVRAHPFAIPGMPVDLILTIEDENGFRDTTTYSFRLGSPEDGDPFGPDEFGYVCFDSGDEDWEMAPRYEWIEIDPDEDADFQGENTGLVDTRDDGDRSAVFDLPFVFQYYGEEFDELTICTNGWAAFGRWTELTDFRNRHVNSGAGPNSQLSVFWDNLYTGKILTYYDEEGGRFIVEWNDMQRQWETNVHNTFELILYDPEVHQTYSGDGIIVYQYKEFRNGSNPGLTDTPYCTIGLGNLDDTDGLEYTYWNQWTDGATRLENEMAIKFTTAIQYITGVLTGTVLDEATGEPTEGAWVTTTRGFADETDENGVYLIDDILIADGYLVSATALGYNDSTKLGPEGEGYTILEAETTRVDFNLLHPEFNVDQEEFYFIMLVDSTTETEFILTNDGNGTLDFSSRYTYPPLVNRDEPDDPLDMITSWTAQDSVDDPHLKGVTFVEDRWYVAGRGDPDEGLHYFYIFDEVGNYLDRLVQPRGDTTGYGIRDMEYYDGYLYCVDWDDYLLKVDPETGELVEQWSLPNRLRSPQAITVDFETGHFWLSAIRNDLYEVELREEEDGDTLVTLRRYDTRDPRDDQGIARYGITWFKDDPDGYPLYIVSNKDIEQSNQFPDITLYKMNPEDGDVRVVGTFPFLHPSCKGRGGISITPKWSNNVLVMGALIENTVLGDFIGIFEIAANTSWIDYSPRTAVLEAEDILPISLEINTADLDTGRYQVFVEFSHNAGDGITEIPVILDIVLELPDDLVEHIQNPFEYALHQNYPNPFNPTTGIAYSLREAGFSQLKVF
ncbi:MAG: C25 family cysteine peptidase, partial [Candidatus Electryoneaceae bacterium]|nr:C25 family cysteine peptidase [Candidatus Electryoneaceae bacterium]